MASVLEELRAERERLAASELRTRAILESAPDGVVTIDGRGVVTEWNATAERIFGWSRAEAIGRELEAVIIPPHRREAFRAWIAARAAEGALNPFGQRLEVTSLRRSGQEFPVELTISSPVLPEGRHFTAFVRDLTERRALEHEQRLLSTLVETVEDYGIYTIDVEGRVITWNVGAERITGYRAEEIVGSHFTCFYTPEDLAQRKHEAALASARATGRYVEEGWRVRADGSRFWASITLNALRDASGELVGFSKITRDLTEQRVLEEAQRRLAEELERRVQDRTAQLEVARDAAQAANRAKSEFLANMSHEIRTPLNAVIGLTELVMRSAIPDEQRDRLVTVIDSAETLLSLLNDVLDLSKIEAGKLGLEQVPFSVHDTIADTLRAFALRAEHKGLALRSEVGPEVPPVLLGDPGRLRQVISNLVHNAIKFTDRGEVVLRVGADEIGASARLVVAVSDTGIGLAAADLARIFEPFVQGDPSTTRRFGGSGLGLAICRQLVELLGGEISVESTPDLGSTFRFTARFGVSERDAPVKRGARSLAQREPPEIAPLPPLRILLVEDSAANRQVAVALLEGQGHRIEAAEDGREALARLAASAFDVVLMDVQMPGMDGVATTEAIRAREASGGARVPIVAMTAHALRGDREKYLASGMDDYVAKPVRRRELFEALARVTVGAPPRIDWPAFAEDLGGDTALLREVAAAYAGETREQLARLPECVARGDAAAVRRLAHTLRGAMLRFGATAPARRAQVLEELAARGELAGAAELLAPLREAIAPILREVDEFAASGSVPRGATAVPAEDA